MRRSCLSQLQGFLAYSKGQETLSRGLISGAGVGMGWGDEESHLGSGY